MRLRGPKPYGPYGRSLHLNLLTLLWSDFKKISDSYVNDPRKAYGQVLQNWHTLPLTLITVSYVIEE